MREFRDRVAVITGAASGIGRAIADRCAQEGMKIVLADIEEPALAAAEAAVALAIALNFYNNHATIDVDSADELKG